MTPTPSKNPAVIEAGRIIAPDPIDDAAGDPLVERYARARKESQTSKVIDLLDELERSRK